MNHQRLFPLLLPRGLLWGTLWGIYCVPGHVDPHVISTAILCLILWDTGARDGKSLA